MIKLVSIHGGNTSEKVVTLYSDTKAEVAVKGEDTVVSDFSEKISTGSIIYTANLEIALLKSNDTWNWVQ